MNSLYSELQWLLPAPRDFSERLKALSHCAGPLGENFQALSQYALDLNQLTRLAKAISRAKTERKSLEPLAPFRLAVLSNATTHMFVPALIGSAARRGIALEVIEPPYNQVAQEALTPDSTVNASKPDAVLLALDYHALALSAPYGNRKAAAATVDTAISHLSALRDGIRANSTAVCIFQSLAPPIETLFGNLDRALAGTTRSLIDAVNRELADLVSHSDDLLLDIAGLAETVGLAQWHNHQLWNLAKLPFALEFLPLYADHVSRILAALRGNSRKVLILDLDNTVWGGVIGDDGPEGIRIAQGDPVGEAYRSVQRMALALRERGVVLAVSSKNSDDVARAPFRDHPEMLLKLEHIAVFQANWNDKVTNIQAIARELSLGLDSLVLLDDNPAERGLIRKLLPQVAVPELPEDPCDYARTLAAAGYFEALTIAAEDLERANYYQNNAKRATLQTEAEGVDAYLESLEMSISFQPFSAQGRARVAQLINKSNQYNLTTRRYTEPELIELERDPNIFTLQVRLADIFGDTGMISIVICRRASPDTWLIDTWLMSCRVLGRKVEYTVLRELLHHARAAGIRKLNGAYRPTERNRLVADHYARLGFTKLHEAESGVTEWELLVENATVSVGSLANVVSTGFTPATGEPVSEPHQTYIRS